MDERTIAAIEATDFATLQRIIDGHCEARDWDALARLRVHCRHALERGKQLWGVEEHIRYRLVLEAPGDIAATVVEEGPARFTLGPLTEVVASTHDWADLEPWLGPGPWRSTIAHERVVRGEDLTGEDGSVFDIPLRLEPWEPTYRCAEYRSDRVEQTSPDAPRFDPTTFRPGAVAADEPESIEAVRQLTSAWVEQSSGRAETVAVEGTAVDAIGALGVRTGGIVSVGAAEAIAWMAWAASVGGLHGRRRGAAAGRFSAWWAAAHLTAVEWPPRADELGEVIDELDWYLWSDGSTGGWRLNLAVEDADHGIAWATGAVDLSDDG